MIEFFPYDERVGLIPQFLSVSDPRSAKEQLNTAYAHGGGWRPMTGWKHKGAFKIKYPGDPTLTPVSVAKFRDEIIVVYPHAWIAIFQPDGTFEAARMD